MIVWSEKEGHRRQRPAKQVVASGELSTKRWVTTAPTIINKVQITKASVTLTVETSPVNPHDSAPLT